MIDNTVLRIMLKFRRKGEEVIEELRKLHIEKQRFTLCTVYYSDRIKKYGVGGLCHTHRKCGKCSEVELKVPLKMVCYTCGLTL
jgi:hypothetical protein